MTVTQAASSSLSTMPGFVVNYTPVAMAKRAATFRSIGRRRLVSFFITLAIDIAFYFWFRPAFNDWFFWLLIASVIYSLGTMLFSFWRMRGARKVTSQVPYGPALQVDAAGLVLATTPAGERIYWDEITSLKGENKYFNPGPQLVFRWGEGREWKLPMVVMDALPGTIDSAMRAYSRGKYGLDLSAVDELW